jgi:protein FRG1
MSDKPKSKRLAFKGEKKSKKRKVREVDEEQRAEDIDPGSECEITTVRNFCPNRTLAWVQPETPEQVLGPTFIMHDSGTPTCVAFDSTRNRINIQTLSSASSSSGETSKPLSIVPTEVHQVWVATRVAGSLTINLRTPEGKFLSCDALGLVSADREARGPQEEFTPIILPESDEQGNHMVAFKNIYEKYISVDEVAGGQTTLRGDSETVGFNERFWVRVQYEYKRKAGEEDRKKAGKNRPQDIDEVGSK